jgi:hypothetical protein
MDSLVRAQLQLQEDDKETVADFLGSQQKLGRRFKKNARDSMSSGCHGT